MSREKDPQEREPPEVPDEPSFLVTQRLGDYMDARNSGKLPTKEAREAKARVLSEGLSNALRKELASQIDLFEGFQVVLKKRRLKRRYGGRHG